LSRNGSVGMVWIRSSKKISHAAGDRHIEGFGESCPLTIPRKRSRQATATRAVIKTYQEGETRA
jgi:hypothetical protein